MNKQIKQLAIEAGATERSMCYGHGDYRTELVMTGETIEKFATAIAAHCVKIAKDDNPIYHAEGAVAWRNAIDDATIRIKLFFGVKK